MRDGSTSAQAEEPSARHETSAPIEGRSPRGRRNPQDVCGGCLHRGSISARAEETIR